ncbi:glucose 1-dehydrogenase [Pedobacter changchengzhani]|uniref:Glucose 1-dehydrogenase n=1 Tax=Pedobacter changchengzhani TaxID=2529274 RepID=A0A4R5MKP5_9SPHI|nr:glucose 1-dehydrogenase [Pedobacter changchengzhani]TDG36244.1 glucose 1-dehydrogenase [Pedobacter changchengzhani]
MGLEQFSLKGKIALVTGGGTGIGLGISKAFIAAGAQVVITGRRESILADATKELGTAAHYIVNDITDLAAIPTLVEGIEKNIGAIDILVNNAGINHKAWAQDTTDEDFARIIQTNLLSVFSLTRACAKNMLARKKGSIIMISSMAGLFGIDRVVAYSVSKTALTGMVNAMVTEYSKDNVRVNAIAPGWINSAMFLKAIDQDVARKEKITNRIAMDHFGEPEDIGNAALFLSSDAAKYITGVILPVDGGATVNF